MADLLEVWKNGQTLDRLEARPVARRFLLQVVERVLEKAGCPLSAADREELHEVAYRRWLETSQGLPRFRPHEETGKFTRPAYHLTFKSQPSQRPDGGPTFDRVLLNPWAEERHLAWQLGVQVDFRPVPDSPDRWLPAAIIAGVHAWAIDTDGSRLRGSYGQGNRNIHPVIGDKLEQAGVPGQLQNAWSPLGVAPERYGDLPDGHLMLGVRLDDPHRWASAEELIDHCAALLAAAWSVLPRPPEVEPVNGPQSQATSPPSSQAVTGEGSPEEDGQQERWREHRPRLAHRLARYLAARGLEYSPDQIAAVYTACKTKGFVILAGLSGTGKTRLARELAALLDRLESEWGPKLSSVSLITELEVDRRTLDAVARALGHLYRLRVEKRRHRSFFDRWPACIAVTLTGVAAHRYQRGTYWPYLWEALDCAGRPDLQDATAWGKAYL
ncbi:MAG: hypothetical protein LOD90_03035, partial [Symbiobacteriaceae bacterium]